MSFLGLDIGLFDTLIIVNVLSVFFTFVIGIQTLKEMRQENKQEYAHQLREYQRRKHNPQQHEDSPLVLKIPNKKEKFLDGNDIVVVSKKVRQSTAQKISQNIGE